MKKSKYLNLGPKMPHLCIFGLEFGKKLLLYLKSAHSNLSNCKNFVKESKCLNLGPKIPYFGIFGLEIESNIAIFETSNLKFVLFQNFEKKVKRPKFGIEKTIVIFEIITLELALLQSLVQK